MNDMQLSAFGGEAASALATPRMPDAAYLRVIQVKRVVAPARGVAASGGRDAAHPPGCLDADTWSLKRPGAQRVTGLGLSVLPLECEPFDAAHPLPTPNPGRSTRSTGSASDHITDIT